MDEKTIKLHVGCGTKKLPGWVNIDSVAALQPDLVHDLTEKLPYGDQTADEVLAEDLLEHFDKYMRIFVFNEWARVLKIGGTITIQVPDFEKSLKKIGKFGGMDNFVDHVFGENLWNSKFYNGHFGNHKWGYAPKTLAAFIKPFGIDTVKAESVGLNIRLTGRKVKHVDQAMVDQMVIASHPNKFGPGPAEVTYAFARAKMREYDENQNRQK